jgi:hypothetical protein
MRMMNSCCKSWMPVHLGSDCGPHIAECHMACRRCPSHATAARFKRNMALFNIQARHWSAQTMHSYRQGWAKSGHRPGTTRKNNFNAVRVKRKRKVTLSLCLTVFSTTPWRRIGEQIYRSSFSWPRSSWWVVSFTPLLLNPEERSTGNEWYTRLGGPQS